MKKIIAYAAPFAMAISAGVAMPTAANAAAGGNSDNAAMCQALAAVTDMSVGTCMNLSSGGNPAPICMLIKDVGLLEAFGFKNQGQCMKELR